MFAVMKELVQQKYTRLVYPEHPRGIDYDREQPNFRSQYPGGGGYAAFAFNVGYTRAMMQAAFVTVQRRGSGSGGRCEAAQGQGRRGSAKSRARMSVEPHAA